MSALLSVDLGVATLLFTLVLRELAVLAIPASIIGLVYGAIAVKHSAGPGGRGRVTAIIGLLMCGGPVISMAIVAAWFFVAGPIVTTLVSLFS